MSAILHLLSRSSSQGDGLRQCLSHVSDSDALVLLEEAVVEALAGAHGLGSSENPGVAVYVMQAELDLRGLGERQLIAGVMPIDYAALVGLVTDFPLNQTWS